MTLGDRRSIRHLRQGFAPSQRPDSSLEPCWCRIPKILRGEHDRRAAQQPDEAPVDDDIDAYDRDDGDLDDDYYSDAFEEA
jgi:hypothetical protein